MDRQRCPAMYWCPVFRGKLSMSCAQSSCCGNRRGKTVARLAFHTRQVCLYTWCQITYLHERMMYVMYPWCTNPQTLTVVQCIQYKIAVITHKAGDFHSAVHRQLLQHQLTTRSLRSTDAPRLCTVDTHWDSQASILRGGSERLELSTKRHS